jgi:hypothetical protein
MHIYSFSVPYLFTLYKYNTEFWWLAPFAALNEMPANKAVCPSPSKTLGSTQILSVLRSFFVLHFIRVFSRNEYRDAQTLASSSELYSPIDSAIVGALCGCSPTHGTWPLCIANRFKRLYMQETLLLRPGPPFTVRDLPLSPPMENKARKKGRALSRGFPISRIST